jgi:hypothetical protein
VLPRLAGHPTSRARSTASSSSRFTFIHRARCYRFNAQVLMLTASLQALREDALRSFESFADTSSSHRHAPPRLLRASNVIKNSDFRTKNEGKSDG